MMNNTNCNNNRKTIMLPDTSIRYVLYVLTLIFKQRPHFRNPQTRMRRCFSVSEIWPWYEAHTDSDLLLKVCELQLCTSHVVRLWAVCVVSRTHGWKHNSLQLHLRASVSFTHPAEMKISENWQLYKTFKPAANHSKHTHGTTVLNVRARDGKSEAKHINQRETITHTHTHSSEEL